MLSVYIACRADTKNRLDEFITWGEGIIVESADLFLVSPFAATCPKVVILAHPLIGCGDLTSSLRNNENGAVGYSAEPFLGPTEDCEIGRRLERF